MLRLDLMRLASPERFQLFCSRIVRRSFPRAHPMGFASWDGGRDIVMLVRVENNELVHEAVWQAKFTNRLNSTTKRAVAASIRTLRDEQWYVIRKWILCLPVDPSGPFHDWLAAELSPTTWEWEVWGATVLLEKLEANPDITEAFFYAEYEELRQHFAVEKLELVRFCLDPSCEWSQRDAKVLHFKSENVVSPDLVFDVIVRNTGRIDALMQALEVQFIDWEWDPHGLPGEGLLFPQVTYEISINHGRPGSYRSLCEPPLVVKAGGLERFKIRLRDTGYAWYGTIVITLDYGEEKRLRLPAVRLYT